MADVAEIVQGCVLSRLLLARQDFHIHAFVAADGEKVEVREQPIEPRDAIAEPEETSSVLSSGSLCEVAVLSQTCDIRNDDIPTLQVAPIWPITYWPESRHGQIRDDKINYLVAVEALPDAILDLHRLTTTGKSSIAGAVELGHLSARDLERVNLKYSLLLGRPALPDDVVGELRTLQEALKKCSSQQRNEIHGVYLAHDMGGRGLNVLIVVDNPNLVPRPLQAGFENWQGDSQASYLRSGTICGRSDVTLADVDQRIRLPLDNLSFPMRLEML